MNSQRGATLVEVLITVLIMAVGLLGLSATQVMSLKNSNNSNHRYLAALASHEMAERMRANPRALELGSYDGETVDGTETSQDCSVPCTPAQLAKLDLYDWGQVIGTNLPAGTGSISRVGQVVTLTVNWKEQHTGENQSTAAGGAEDASFELVVDL